MKIESIKPDPEFIQIVNKVVDQNKMILEQTGTLLRVNLPVEAQAGMPIVAEIAKMNSLIVQTVMAPPVFYKGEK